MAKPKRTTFPGHKVIATVKSVKGSCSWGHEAGDTFSVNCHDNAGLCGYFYHDIFPRIMALQYGGGNPWGNPDVMTLECSDRTNLVTLELRREK
ncbi:MAG: TIGR04076 family protein [Chloroflexi bacterium]|nr:TIGR04076 family protein [Chloroflexota bacterium]